MLAVFDFGPAESRLRETAGKKSTPDFFPVEFCPAANRIPLAGFDFQDFEKKSRGGIFLMVGQVRARGIFLSRGTVLARYESQLLGRCSFNGIPLAGSRLRDFGGESRRGIFCGSFCGLGSSEAVSQFSTFV